jgi:hypothetical protein
MTGHPHQQERFAERQAAPTAGQVVPRSTWVGPADLRTTWVQRPDKAADGSDPEGGNRSGLLPEVLADRLALRRPGAKQAKALWPVPTGQLCAGRGEAEPQPITKGAGLEMHAISAGSCRRRSASLPTGECSVSTTRS